ncbi:MAG: hypothetical protein ACI3ZH_03405 [Candidatus Cryptobacteroides sp.]
MKSIEEIEKMDLEELERVADDTDVSVPEDLRESIEGVLDSLEMLEMAVRRRERRRTVFGATAAAACLVAFILTGLMQHRGSDAPADTFDDPELAYAMVQEALGQVSMNMRKGVDAVGKGREMAELSFETLEEIITKNR